MCVRCAKGKRECNYLLLSKKSGTKLAQNAKVFSESTISDGTEEPFVLPRFESLSSDGTISGNEISPIFHGRIQVSEMGSSSSSEVLLPCPRKVSIFSIPETLPPEMKVMHFCYDTFIPRPPKALSDEKIPYFISYHREQISSGHYIWYHDAHKFCENGVLAVAEKSHIFRYAIAAFSAIVYSDQVHRLAKMYAFIYYEECLNQLRELLSVNAAKLQENLQEILATVLELASVEVSITRILLMLAI